MAKDKATILIVDDEPFNREILMQYLGDKEYEIRTAKDGLDAWTQLMAEPVSFDIVLLDRMMPNMNGMEVLKKIKAHPVLMQLPVILQTALASNEDIAEAMDAGAYYYLTKPFGQAALLSVIQTAVADRLRYRALQQSGNTHRATIGDRLDEQNFSFRTLDEARAIATLLSSNCPEPQRVVVGLAELLINALEHGNLAISYAEKGEMLKQGTWDDEIQKRLNMPEYIDRKVSVKMLRDKEKITFIITDEGEGFDFAHYLEMDPARAFDNHGRGIAISRLMSFDSLEYLGSGNQLLATVKLQ